MTDASGCEEKALGIFHGEIGVVKDTEQVRPSMLQMPMYQGSELNLTAIVFKTCSVSVKGSH